MNEKNYSVGKSADTWKGDKAQTITFIVTNDCNLRCKYCYITHKSNDKVMDFNVAKKFIDYILTTEDIRFSEAVVLEFIGGEPFLEVELIDKICDYFKLKAYILDHDWYWNYRISICTNGVNYSSGQVQNFIRKNYNKMSLSITLDGTKEKHDLQRVFPDASGSYDTIDKNINLWLRQFPGSTKVTFASDDLPLLKDSIIFLWNRGITTVNANVVFEDVWKDGDDKILEDQLMELADYILDNHLFDKDFICSFFDESIGYPYDDKLLNSTYCGAGKMMGLSPEGDLYPCLRYYGHSLNYHEEWPVGNIEKGIDMEKVRPFMLASSRLQSDQECINCDIATGCGFCQGFNYDVAQTPTNFHRAKYICKMHKARVRANDYYFAKLLNRHNLNRPEMSTQRKELYFLLSDDYVSYCSYDNKDKAISEFSNETLIKGLKFAHHHFYKPVFVHSKSNFSFENQKDFEGYEILHIVPAEFMNQAIASNLKEILPVYNLKNLSAYDKKLDNLIFNISASEIKYLFDSVKILLSRTNRINVNITDLNKNFDELEYKRQMAQIKDLISNIDKDQGILKEINLLTDILFINSHDNCKAGHKTFVLAPNEKLYTCCAVYSNEADSNIGNLDEGIIVDYDARLYEIKNSSICRLCDAYQCKNCVYTNRLYTKEVNVSPSFQCRKSHIERLVSSALLEQINHSTKFRWNIDKQINDLGYLDPATAFFKLNEESYGYYKYKKK